MTEAVVGIGLSKELGTCDGYVCKLDGAKEGTAHLLLQASDIN